MDQEFLDTMNEKHMELKDLITEDENPEPYLEDTALLNQLKVLLLRKINVSNFIEDD